MPVKEFEFICKQCGNKKKSRRYDQKNKEHVFCSRECRYQYFRKDSWENSGRYKQNGYWMLRRNIDGKYEHKFEHIYIWERQNGKISKGYEIHHINGKRDDNCLENLQCVSISQHRSFTHKNHKWNSGTKTGKIT